MAVCVLLTSAGTAFAQEKKEAKVQLQELVAKINAKLKEGKETEEALDVEIKTFDTLLKEHKGEQTDDVADILVMKAKLYLEVFENQEKGLAVLKQLKNDFPGTTQGKAMDEVIPTIERKWEGQKLQRQLIPGAVFPDFKEKDLEGKLLSIAGYKGKVVLIDFWATWCGPCVGELPNLIDAYKKYHRKGFEVIGISLDEDRETLVNFLKKRGVPWRQLFDGKGWENNLASRYGVMSIPTTYLLDGQGRIVAKNLDGQGLAIELERLLGRK